MARDKSAGLLRSPCPLLSGSPARSGLRALPQPQGFLLQDCKLLCFFLSATGRPAQINLSTLIVHARPNSIQCS